MTPIYIIATIILLVLQFADAWTTHRILSRGGKELNGVVRFFINKFGLLNGLLIAKVPLGLMIIASAVFQWMPKYMLLGLCALYLLVVLHNFRQLFKNQ